MSRVKLTVIALILGLMMGLSGMGQAAAYGSALPPAPGEVRGIGTHFEVTDSDYLNVELSSTEVIDLVMTSVPEIVSIHLSSAEGASSTELILNGLESGATYYFQVNGAADPPQFNADADGSYSWTQDISKAYYLRIRPELGTLNIDATGGDCTTPHIWDPGTLTCSLGQDVDVGSVTILSTGITLNGNGWVIRNGAEGVLVSAQQEVILTNLDIRDTAVGVRINAGSINVTLSNSTIVATAGIDVINTDSLVISDNDITSSSTALNRLEQLTNSEVLRNNFTAGFVVMVADNIAGVTFTGNNFSSPVGGLIIQNSTAAGNVLTLNTFTDSVPLPGLWLFGSSNITVYNNNFAANSVHIQVAGTGNVFNQDLPPVGAGGNWFDTYDVADPEGCFDDNPSDGFCDAPFVIDADNEDTHPSLTRFNRPPACQDLAVVLTEDISGPAGLSCSDIDTNDTISIAILDVSLLNGVTGLSVGSVTVPVNLVPDPNHNGSGGSFTYQATDSAGATSAVATVTITITPVNDPPVAADDSATVAPGGTVSILDSEETSVLANDSDVDSSVLTATVLASPSNGSSFTLQSDGTFSYTHDGSATTSDFFTYTVSDGSLSDTARVDITVKPVNTPPVGVDDSATVLEGGTVTVLDTSATSVLANDTDVDGPSLSATVLFGPANGSLTLNLDGTFSYTHFGGENTGDSFTYTVSDGSLSDTATVTIDVTSVNDPPVGVDDSATVLEGSTVTVLDTSATSVLANDTDVDGPSLSATVLSGPANGSLTLNFDGTFSYTHFGGENTGDSFTYTVSDGSLSDTAIVTITVTPVNDPPIVNAGPDQSVNEGDNVQLAGAASDPEGAQVTLTWTQPTGQSVVLSDPNVLNPSFTAPEVASQSVFTFVLTVCDAAPLCVFDDVEITVNDLTPSESQPARSKGYWKNHPDDIEAILAAKGDIPLGDVQVTNTAQAVDVLSNSSAKNASNSLRAQLLAAILNLRNDADAFATGTDIRLTVDLATQFLSDHSGTPVERKHEDRQGALQLKDALDEFNNTGE